MLVVFVPESPKYVFSRGDEDETLRIFQRIYKLNTGKPEDTYPVKALIRDGEFGQTSKSESESFFNFMWSQSVPLFKGSHLRNILTACFIQFTVCLTSNGFWTFLPEILNKLSLWIESSGAPATVCEIYYKEIGEIGNQTILETKCLDKLEVSTFYHIYELCILYSLAFMILSFTINATGKLVIIIAVTLACGLAAFSLIFIKIPSIIAYLYLVMLLAGLLISVVNSSTVELFPTKMRFFPIIF